MEIDEAYKGREHSYIKHRLLESYLEKLLLIKGVTGTRELAYVDCFAGPWGDESDDLKTTSIAISLNILKKVRDVLAAQHKYVTMRAIYVEKSKKRFERLKSYLETNNHSGVQAHPIYGDYAEKTEEILRQCGNSFTFFFVDPKKWTPIAIPRLLPLLKRENSEFVITFMYDFFNRAIGQEGMREQVHSLLGSLTDVELDDICSLEPKQREQAVLNKYRDALKAGMKINSNRYPRSYYTTVLDKDKDRTKYHLVYLTRHSKGIVEFAKLSEYVEIIQHKVRFETKQARMGTTDMFGIDGAEIHDLEAADAEDVKSYWMDKLETTERIFTEDDLANMLEDTDWLISDFQKGFRELLDENKVENLDTKGKRTVHQVHFDKGERLRRCV